MEHRKIKAWLDAWVDDIEKRRTLVNFNSQIKTHELHDYIFLSKGIDLVASAMGINLKEDFKEEEREFPYRYSFTYRGIEFIQYERERLVTDNVQV